MRIDFIKINGHKNFNDFKVDFREDYLINILLGRNGTGKSNLIEFIVSTFQRLASARTPKDFFEIDYSFEIQYSIFAKDREYWFNLKRTGNDNSILYASSKEGLIDNSKISFSQLKRLDENFFLPKYLIGYYSGESKRLSEIFKKPEEDYYRAVRQNKDQELDFRRFFYADDHHCQLLLISLLAFADEDKDISNLLAEYLDYKEFVDFTITLKSPDWNKGVSLNDGIDKFWGAKGSPFRFCNYLLAESKEQPIVNLNASLDIDNKIRESISFYLKGGDFVKNAPEYFDSGLNLFRHLESTYISNLIDRIVIRIRKTSSNDVIEFTELSEGEQQLITIIGLLLFTSEENTLFLLDEPDTHLNPNWQRDYLGLFNRYSHAKNSQIIISTHSPLLVQSADEAGLILLKLEEGRPVSNSDGAFISNWRIDQVLTSEFFGLKSSRPAQLDEYMAVRTEILAKANITEDDLDRLQSYENQFGVLPTGESINEFKAQVLINKIASRVSDQDGSDKKN
jgi:ABC-type cobalamin/Fe3+-siderophores transport system ATPase subunit